MILVKFVVHLHKQNKMKRKIAIFKYWLISLIVIYLTSCFVDFQLLTPLEICEKFRSLNEVSRFIILVCYIGAQIIYYMVLDTFVLPPKERIQTTNVL